MIRKKTTKKSAKAINNKYQEEYIKNLIKSSKRKKFDGKKFKTVLKVLLIIWVLSFFIGKAFSGEVGNKVAIIPIEGPIMSSMGASPFGGNAVDSETIVDLIEEASEAKNVKAIILKINSPGGTVVASKEIARAVKELEIPVVSVIREVGASGAYWIASASDYIIADEMSITGSIGVNGGYLEFSGLMDEYGVSYEEMTAGKYKDMGNKYEKLNSKEREIMQKKLDLIYENFLGAVAENRNLTYTRVAEIAEGLYYLGVEAMEFGLIDEFGGMKEGKEKVENLTGLALEEKVYEVDEGFFSAFDMIGAKSSYGVGRGIGDSFIKGNINSGYLSPIT